MRSRHECRCGHAPKAAISSRQAGFLAFRKSRGFSTIIAVDLLGQPVVEHAASCDSTILPACPRSHIGGTPFNDHLKMLHVWVKQGRAWRLAAHQTTKLAQ
jgi:hypothetical protein